jgi:hypothetical protein
MRAKGYWEIASWVAAIGAIGVAFQLLAYSTAPDVDVRYEGDNLIAYDPEIGFVARPNGVARRTDPATGKRGQLSYSVYTDDRGARVSTPGSRSLAHVNFVTIGDSLSWGHGVEAEQTYTDVLAQRSGLTAENFSVASFGTVQSLQTIKRNLDLAPKLVIYGFMVDHLRRNVVPCAPSYYPFCLDASHVAWDGDGHPRIAPPATDGVRRLYAHIKPQHRDPLTWLSHGADVIVGRAIRRWGEVRQGDDRKREEALTFLLAEMNLAVEAGGAKLLVLYIPINYDAAPPALLRPVNTLELPLLDMTDIFRRSRDAGGPGPYIPDDGHLSVAGHAVVADAVAEFADRHHLLEARR